MAATLHIGQTITVADGTSGTITGYNDDDRTWRVTHYHGTDSPMVGRPSNHDHLTTEEITELLGEGEPPLTPSHVYRITVPPTLDSGARTRVYASTRSAVAWLKRQGFDLHRTVTAHLVEYRRDTGDEVTIATLAQIPAEEA